ncbi:MAG: hypothetical protein E7052_01445 [Lentisphaerae bacterium]|nr:hypothetical protein [Lentisphaerota bacterium]
MKRLRKSHLILIAVSLLILAGCIGLMGYLLVSNYQNVELFKQAQSNFQRGDAESLAAAEAQLRQLIADDDDNEAAYIILGAIAEKRKVYPELVYYSYKAHKLNPLSAKNRADYLKSLQMAREFERLENFLSHQMQLSGAEEQLLLYAAGRNGNYQKYKHKTGGTSDGNALSQLTAILYKEVNQPVKLTLDNLKKISAQDAFLEQEILAAQAELYLLNNDIKRSEEALVRAYKLNEFAFAPALGRFYANFRSFKAALTVFEKYLAIYHDQAVALQTAELYCLLDQVDKIAQLRQQYQSDNGSSAMLCCYYLDALIALAKNDLPALKELVMPLRKNINTPLAAFMFLCVDIYSNDLNAVRQSYANLLTHRNYLDLQQRADRMVEDVLKSSLSKPSAQNDTLVMLAQMLYRRRPTAFAAKFILLTGRNGQSVNAALLRDALKKFGSDPGIIKIAIEHFLTGDLLAAEKYIRHYRELFPEKKADMLRYEIMLAGKRNDLELVSKLFMENFSPELCAEYWRFASATLREKDLRFLSRKNPLYAPWSQALLLLKNGNKNAACELLDKADAKGDQSLLFLAARLLAENGRNQAALNKYAQFPANSPYQLAILLNTSELYAENGDLLRALDLSQQAYKLSPELPETQLCYSDKLQKNRQSELIPEVIKLSGTSPYSRKLKALWIDGMQQRISSYDLGKQREKLREVCRQLLVVDPGNRVAEDCLKKLNKMPQ